MPSRAMSHIQNTAPGPPQNTASPTPTMLPEPMVLARAVERASKGDRVPCAAIGASASLRRKTLPRVWLQA